MRTWSNDLNEILDIATVPGPGKTCCSGHNASDALANFLHAVDDD